MGKLHHGLTVTIDAEGIDTPFFHELFGPAGAEKLTRHFLISLAPHFSTSNLHSCIDEGNINVCQRSWVDLGFSFSWPNSDSLCQEE